MTHPADRLLEPSRRTLLKGLPLGLAGLALVSPLWSRLLSTAMAQEVSRQRFIVWYTADGTVPEFFWGATPGALAIRADRTNDLTGKTFNTAVADADRATFVLQPLADYAANTLLVKGLSNPGDGDHVPAVRSCLTGEAVRGKDASGSTPSLDVLMAEVHGTERHAEPVLRTGVYGSRVSYSGTRDLSRPRGRSFVEPSWQPTADARRVLDAVGATPSTPAQPGGSAKNLSRLAALGAVRERVEALRCAAGTPAATRLEAYVDEVARLERLENEMRGTDPIDPGTPLVDPAAPGITAAQADTASLSKVAPFVRDLAVTALAMQYSPVVTIQWGASGSNNIEGGRLTDTRYDFIQGLEYKGAGDHGLAHPEDGAFQDAGHNITAAVSTRDRIRIQRWFYAQLALMLDRLKATPDGDGTLFDNTTILCVSEFGGPNANSTSAQHSPKNLPYVLIAGANTPFKTGEYMAVERSHGDYLLTLARGFGSTESSLGVGTRLIDGILKA